MDTTARSLLDAYCSFGFISCESVFQWLLQGIFAEEALDAISEALNNRIFCI